MCSEPTQMSTAEPVDIYCSFGVIHEVLLYGAGNLADEQCGAAMRQSVDQNCDLTNNQAVLDTFKADCVDQKQCDFNFDPLLFPTECRSETAAIVYRCEEESI